MFAKPGSLALLLVLTAGCAKNGAATDAYSRQVSTASLRVAQLEAEVAASEQRIAAMEEAVRARGASEVTSLQTIEEVNTEIGRMRGDIEVLQYEVGEMRRALDTLLVEQERRFLYAEKRLGQLEAFLGVQPPPPPTNEELGIVEGDTGEPVAEGDPIDGAAEAAAADLPQDAAGKLELAMEHMEAGRNGVARVILQKAMAEHPEASEISEIRYRLAETYFNENNWSKAIGEFNTVIETYPKSPWAPWAMLAQGDAFAQWGQGDNAKVFYEEVLRVYPKSEAAKEAKKLLNP